MEEQIKFDSHQISATFNEIVGDQTSFLKPNEDKAADFRDLTFKLFKCLKDNYVTFGVKNLITKGFDEEQIWAQLERDNNVYLEKVTDDVKSVSLLWRKINKGDVGPKDTISSMLEPIKPDDDEEEEEEEDYEDYEDDDDGDEDEQEQYDFLEPASSDEDDDDEIDRLLGPKELTARNNLSTFEREQLQIKEKIAKLEEENLQAKPWKLIGEVTADKRPDNSLLEDHLQYDFVSRPAPIIDEQVALKIEDLIKQRIKDGIWDDVERKVKPKEQPFDYKRRLILDQEKSKVGLAEIYEKDYLQRKQEEKTEEENEAHKEIRKMMSSIFLQLDSLSSFHFTPKPPEPEIKIVNNLPAITAEDAIPLAVSEATLLAPEEILEKPKRPVKGATEKETTDRKHDRRIKKKRQKIIANKKNKKEPTKIDIQNKTKQTEKIQKTNAIKQFKPAQLKT